MSALPAARPANRLEQQGTFIRSLKERNLFTCTLALDKEGRLIQRGESPGIGDQSTEKARGLVAG